MDVIRRYGKLYLGAVALFTALALLISGYTEKAVRANALGHVPRVIIDPGHGGEDGGAVSVTGVNESTLNLEISLRVRDLLRLCGVSTAMTREGDYAIYDDDCVSISQKKSSDLRNRVAIARDAPDAILLSIHQNQFPEGKYRGAQTFYNACSGSEALAEQIQEHLRQGIDPRNRRQIKPAEGIYLMEKVPNTAVLVESGFISNVQEEALLRSADYQRRVACAIGSGLLEYLREQTLL